MTFYAEAPPEEVELAREWSERADIGETYAEFVARMGWPKEPEQEMPFEL